MAEYKKRVDFANFVCHFGGDELLTYLREIVLPAFKGDYVRIYGEERMFLHNVEVLKLKNDDETDEIVVAGQFVVDTKFKRTQIFAKEIIPSAASLEVALSSFFVLRLRDHKLFYVKEVSGAPGLAKFRSTIESFFRRSRNDYIGSLFEKLKSDKEQGIIDKRVTKKAIAESIGVPNLEIVPLPGKGSLSSFINQFKTLSEIQVRMVKPNNELDNSDLFEGLRSVNKKLDSELTTITYRNPEGLTKSNVEDQLEGALDGNSELRLKGKREDGSKLNGSNDDFTVTVPIEIVPKNRKKAADVLNRLFKDLVKRGSLSIAKPVPNKSHEAKLDELAQSIGK
jgi:hypothetical protein